MIDPSIPLQTVNVGQQISQGLAQGEQMRAARQAQQLQQYSVLQAKQDFEDQQKLKNAWRQAAGDPTQTVANYQALGGGMKTLQAYQMQQLQVQNQLANLRKTNSEATEKDFGNAQAATNRLYEIGSQQLDALKDPAKFAQARENVLNQAQGEKLMTGDSADQLRQLPQQDFIDRIYHLRSLKAASTESGIAKDTAQAGEATAKTTNLNAERPGIDSDNALKAATALQAKKAEWAGKLQQAFTAAGGGQQGLQAYDKLRSTVPADVVDYMPATQSLITAKKYSFDTPNEAALRAIQMGGMKDEEKATLSKQLEDTELNKKQGENTDKYHQQQLALDQIKTKVQQQMVSQNVGDREIGALSRVHLTNLNAAQAQLEKINEASGLLTSGNAEAQALAIPKVLTALVSGQGTGVRITQPELSAIGAARGVSGDVQGWLQKMSSGKKLTPTQVTQLQGVLGDIGQRIQQKAEISNDAINKIQNSQDRTSRYAADQEARQKLTEMSESKAGVTVPKGARTGSLPDGTRVFSTDGGRTLFDASTGKKVQ